MEAARGRSEIWSVWARLFSRTPLLYIIHSSKDRPLAHQLQETLKSWGQKAVFLDDDAIPPGAVWESVLLRSILASQAASVVFTTNLEDSAWCLDEIQQFTLSRRRLFPILFDHARPSDRSGLGRYQCIDAAADPSLLRLKGELKRLWPPLWRTMILMACVACLAVVAVAAVPSNDDRKIRKVDSEVFVPYDEAKIVQSLAEVEQIGARKPDKVCDLLARVFAHGETYAWGLQQDATPLAGSTMRRCSSSHQNQLKKALTGLRERLNDVLLGRTSLEELTGRTIQKPISIDLVSVLELCKDLRTALGSRHDPCGGEGGANATR